MKKKSQLFGLLNEKDPYILYFNRPLWTLDEFACLINNFSPDRYRQLFQSDTKFISKEEAKKIKKVLQIKQKFLEDIAENNIENIQIRDEKSIQSSWKFIKWAAENQIPIIFNFFQNLPLYLMELYLEFQRNNSILRLNRKDSLKYHKTYYLKHVEMLIEKEGEMTPTQVYNHPHIQSIESYIRKLGGNYKRRTYLESWLRSYLKKRCRGRPKKKK